MAGITDRRLWIRQQQISKNNNNNIHTQEIKDGDILIWKSNKWINTDINSILPNKEDSKISDSKMKICTIDNISTIDNVEIGDRICVSFTDDSSRIFTWSGNTWQISGETIEIKCCEDLKRGDTVKLSESNYGVEKTKSNNDTITGIAVFDSDIDSTCTIAVSGIWFINCPDIEYPINTKLNLNHDGELTIINNDNYYVTVINNSYSNIVPVLINNKNTIFNRTINKKSKR